MTTTADPAGSDPAGSTEQPTTTQPDPGTSTAAADEPTPPSANPLDVPLREFLDNIGISIEDSDKVMAELAERYGDRPIPLQAVRNAMKEILGRATIERMTTHVIAALGNFAIEGESYYRHSRIGLS